MFFETFGELEDRGQNLNTNSFSRSFRARDIPAKHPGYPPKSFSLVFKRHAELFGPDPFTWRTPHPTGRCSDPNGFVCAPYFLPEKKIEQRNITMSLKTSLGVCQIRIRPANSHDMMFARNLDALFPSIPSW